MKSWNEREILDELAEYAPGLMAELLEFNAREIINLVPLLSEAPHRFQERLARSLHAEIVFEGEVIFAEGECCDYVYFILSGEVEIVENEGSDVEKVVAIIADGSYFGDTSLLLNQPHTASARCKSKVCCIAASLHAERCSAMPCDVLHC